MKAALAGSPVEQGFSTLEILIALGVFVLTITAVIVVVFGNQSVTIDAQTNQEALYKAQAQIENARATAHKNYDGLVSITPTTDGIYTEQLTVTVLSDFSKQVESLVTWQTTASRPQQIKLTTVVSNWQAALGGTCAGALSKDWSNPVILNPAHGIDINPDAITGITEGGGYVYLTGTHPGSKDDFFIIDVSDPTFPKQVGSLDAGIGLAAVTVVGNYAYLANLSTTAQLQVINISNKSAPTLVAGSSRKVPGAGGVGNTIFYNKGKIYLGLTASGAGPQFAVYDVSNPTSPVLVTGGTYSFGHDVNAIRVRGNRAYVATPGSENVTVLDVGVGSPTFMQRLGGYSAPAAPDANGAGSNYGESLDVVGSTVYLGRSYGTQEFYVLNASNPAAISVISSKDLGGGNGTTIYGLMVKSNFAFMTANQAFQVWSLASMGSVYGSLDLSGYSGYPAGGVACDNNYFYLAVFGPSGGSGHNVLQIVGAGAPNKYTLSNSGDVTVNQGGSGNTTVTRTLTSGTVPGVTLTASGLPAGAAASFTNNPCAPTCSSQVTITTSFPTTALGTYPITITGSPGGVTTTFNLIVSAPFDYSLSNGGNITMGQNASGNVTIIRTLVSGTSQPVSLSVGGLPNKSSGNFTNNPCGPTCSSTLTITTAGAKKGTYPIIITGAPNGTGPRTTAFNLIIQ